VESLWASVEADPAAPVTVDLVDRQVRTADLVVDFEIDDYTRWRLLEGLDDVGLTLRHADAVDAFERARPSYLPVTTPVGRPDAR
jgi:3-isopropylmalate/(R)-2-methylmalate dehydratase small subunit